MKLALISLLAAAPAFAADAPKPAAKPAAPKETYKNDDERAIYTIGFLLGRNIAPFNLTLAETKIVSAGLADAALGTAPKVDVRFHQPRVNDLLAKRLEATGSAAAKAAEPEKIKGRAFTEKWVAENKPQAIPGGGWYLETRAGTGALPAKSDTVKVHYRGTTVEGAEFDSSYKRGEPSSFSLGGVIACWTHGIAMMKVGGAAKLVCPSDAAYGDPGRSGIKPGATLIFETELIDIVKP